MISCCLGVYMDIPDMIIILISEINRIPITDP